jgi:DNA-binding transcriptional LysR family regulator
MYSAQDLASFIAVTEAGSVRNAAVILRRTQPAITQAIQRLEEAVGFPLFDRSGYRIRLTEQGTIFADAARAVVDRMKKLRDLSKLLAKGNEPRVRLAFDGAIPRKVWLDLTARAIAQFPGISIELEELEGAAPLRRLQNGVAALAILYDITVERRLHAIEQRSLGSMRFATYVRADRADATGRPNTGLAQVMVVDFEIEQGRFDQVEAENVINVTSHRMQVDAILSGLGWGSAPAELLAGHIAQGWIIQINRGTSQSIQPMPYSLFRLQGTPQGPVANFIWSAAAQLEVIATDAL